ncbi:MAG: hypothetical protein ACFFAS_11895 [Promethearchaeota archaeon]
MSSKNDNLEKITIIAEIEELKLSQAILYSVGKIEQALKISDEIIKLASKINLEHMIKEQEEYVEKIKTPKSEKPKGTDISWLCEHLRNQFDDLLEMDNIKKAHEIVETFKEKYQDHYNLMKIPAVKYCITKDDEIWKVFLLEQEIKVEKLDQFEDQLYKSIKLNDIENANDLIDRAWDYIYTLEGNKREFYQKKWGALEYNLVQKLKYEEYEEIQKIYKKIDKIMENSKVLQNEGQFEEAITLINSEMETFKSKEMNELVSKLEKRLDEIVVSKENLENASAKIAELEQQYKQNREDSLLEESISTCESIISLAQASGKEEIKAQYQGFIDEMRKTIETESEQARKYEDFKKSIRLIHEEALNALDKKNIDNTIENYRKIVSFIKEMKRG